MVILEQRLKGATAAALAALMIRRSPREYEKFWNCQDPTPPGVPCIVLIAKGIRVFFADRFDSIEVMCGGVFGTIRYTPTPGCLSQRVRERNKIKGMGDFGN